jgi:hypothetical protein
MHLYDLVLSPTGLKANQVAILQFIKQCDEVAQWRLAEEFCLSEAPLSRRLTTMVIGLLSAKSIRPKRSGRYPTSTEHFGLQAEDYTCDQYSLNIE